VGTTTEIRTSDAPSSPGPHGDDGHRAQGLQHLPGLTGLRAVAVAAVVAYHLGYLPGGFVGVDLFFVLSGFLITSLLLGRTPDSVRGMFTWWSRRIRRLTPAVAVVVLVVLVVFLTRSGIAIDSLATLTWWQNWHLIAEGDPYWSTTPSPLRHAWSLSIEEQFYLLWPPVLLGLLAVGRRVRAPLRLVLVASCVGAASSFVWAAVLASSATPDLSRIYFGTDTRAGALLVGCAAAVWLRRRPGGPTLPADGTAARLVLPAVATLIALTVLMEPSDRWAYRGGLVAAAASSLVLVLACTHQGVLSTAMSWAPLQWLGERSYAIYLWSWPIQVLVQDRWPDLPLWSVATITVAASLPLADLSRRLVEEPLRRDSSWAIRVVPRRAAWSLGTAALVVAMLVAGSSTRLTTTEQVAQEFERLPDPSTTTTAAPEPSEPPAPGASTTTTTCVSPPTVVPPAFTGDTSSYDPSTVSPGMDPTYGTCDGVLRMLVVGDSTGRGAANGLRRNAPEGFEIWDRTEIGCGLVEPSSECGDWRKRWSDAVSMIDPHVVLVYLGVSDDVVDGQDPPFLSDEASAPRRAAIAEAVQLLRAGGAHVVWSLPPVPRSNGLFFCDGKRTQSPCDPRWIRRWHEDLTAVARENQVGLLDVAGWIEQRGAAPEDRPDGLHLSGPALDAHATWITDQLR
jgi:peptidoglycan/LPS O-acetylase OafA/YrhL